MRGRWSWLTRTLICVAIVTGMHGGFVLVKPTSGGFAQGQIEHGQIKHGQIPNGIAPRDAPTTPQPNPPRMPDGQRDADRVYGSLKFRGLMSCVVFSPDGKHLVTGGTQGIQFWDRVSGEVVDELPVTEQSVHSLAFSHDGTRLAGGSRQNEVAVWDVPNRKKLFSVQHESLRRGYSGVQRAEFFPDDSKILACHADRITKVYDATTGELLKTIDLTDDQLGMPTIAISPAGKTFAVSGEATIRIYDAETYEQLCVIKAQELPTIASLAYLSETELLSSGAEEVATQPYPNNRALLRVWDITSGEVVRVLTHDEFFAGSGAVFALTGDRKRVIVQTEDTLRVYDPDTTKELGRIAVSARFGPGNKNAKLAISADGAMIARVGSRVLRLFDAVTLAEIVEPDAGHDGEIYFAKPSPDGTLLATAGTDGQVIFWNAATTEKVHEFAFGGSLSGLRDAFWSPDGKLLYVAGYHITRLNRFEQNEVHSFVAAYDVTRQAKAFEVTYTASDAIAASTISRDGKLLAVPVGHQVVSPNKLTVQVHNAVTGQLICSLKRFEEDDTMYTRFSADGRRLYTMDYYNGRKWNEWDARTGELIETHTLDVAVGIVSMSSDGSLVTFASRDADKVAIHDAETLEKLRELELPNVLLLSAAFSSNRQLLVTASHDAKFANAPRAEVRDAPQIIRVWDAGTGKLLHKLETAARPGTGLVLLELSPDGETLYGDRHGVGLAWDLEDD